MLALSKGGGGSVTGLKMGPRTDLTLPVRELTLQRVHIRGQTKKFFLAGSDRENALSTREGPFFLTSP